MEQRGQYYGMELRWSRALARRSSAHGWVQCGVAARAAGSRPAQAEGGAARGQGARGAAEPCTASGTALAVAHMTRGKRRKALALEALVVADARKGQRSRPAPGFRHGEKEERGGEKQRSAKIRTAGLKFLAGALGSEEKS